MERQQSSDIDSNDNGEELTTDQIKQKAQEIAKRFEKYQGRYHTTSSRCNTPLPITSADSVESIHSSVISDTSEKVLLFRQFLENDRKLVENSKIDEQNYNSDDHASDDKSLGLLPQNEKEKLNSTYYEDIISAQFKEKNIHSLKTQVDELNKKLENYHNMINEKDIVLQSKMNTIESLNKAITQKNKLHSETVEALKKRNIEIINEERLRCAQKIKHITEETEELKDNLDYFHQLCEDLKKDNIEFDKDNTELRQRETKLKSDIENMRLSYEQEKKSILKHNQQSSKKVIDDMENKLMLLQQENDSLTKRIYLLEGEPMNVQEKDHLLDQLNMKDVEIQRLNVENQKLNTQFQNQITEAQQTENRWIQLKDAYLNDKNRMTFLEKVIEELKMNNDELNNSNVKLTEEIEKSKENLTVLRVENDTHIKNYNDLRGSIEDIDIQFKHTMEQAIAEYEQDKKQLNQQHENDLIALKTCNNKLEESTLKLNEVTNQLNIVLKENNLYKSELDNYLHNNDMKVLELNNTIHELQNQTSQLTSELEFLKKENMTLSDKLSGTSFEIADSRSLSEKLLRQKQLLKVKMKALKDSDNNCLVLKNQVVSLNEELETKNQKLENLIESNKQINVMLEYCGNELQKCYELINEIVFKSNLQNKNIHIVCCILINLVSMLSFDDYSSKFDNDLVKIVDSVCDIISGDCNLQTCVKKMVLGSVHVLEYIINIKDSYKLSKAKLIARTEVDKLVSEALETVMLTQNEYQKQNNELISLVEILQNDNQSLKLKMSSRTFEAKEVLTDINGSAVENLLSVNNLDIENIKNENDTFKQFLMNILEKLGLNNMNKMVSVQFQNSLNELESIVYEMKNENILLKDAVQSLEQEKLIYLKTLEQPIEQKTEDHSNSISQNSFIQAIVNVENNVDDKKLISENVCIKQLRNTDKSSSTVDSVAVNDDLKSLLVRYKNLKSRYKIARTTTVELEEKIGNLTNELECVNSKYKQLNDQYVSTNDTYEADIANFQSEIENLMYEKLEAHRQLAALKERHEILQNDYDQLKSNLDEKNNFCSTDTTSTYINEQSGVLKGQLNDTQRLIDSAYSRVLNEWPPIDTSSDWVIVQSRKLDKIVDAKCNPHNSCNNDLDDVFGLEESEVKRLQKCVQIIHELITTVLTNENIVDDNPINLLVELMTDLKSYTETFLEFISVKYNKLHLVNERHIELPQNVEDFDSNTFLSNNISKQPPISSEESSVTEERIKASLSENEEHLQFQRAFAERDRLIEFLSDKISTLEQSNRNIDDIKSVREKLDRALTAVHERDVRCDELTLELTRLLEERDMLQLKLSNSIRQIQFLSENKPQLGTPNVLEENYGSKTIDDKLEELQSLEYRKDADLFVDQEQRHMSQMQLHQNHQNIKTMLEAKSSNVNEEATTSTSWFKDLLW